MMIFRKIIRLVSGMTLACVLTSCLSSSYTESYTLIANFEYGSVLELRADSTFYAESGFSIPYNYLAFCHEIDPDTKENKGGFRLSALEGLIKPQKEEDDSDGETESTDVVPELGIVWRAHTFAEPNTYMVYYMSQDRPSHDIEFLLPTNGVCALKSCKITNTAKVAEDLAGKFERGDKMVLTAVGYKGGVETGRASFTLADYTQNDKVGQPKDSIVSRWTSFDLSALGAIERVKFEIESSKDVQKYFCLDDLIADITVSH